VSACPACGKELPGEFPFCPHCGAPLGSESREQRKTVTVLFCDVAGSTALGESTDPEALRALLARYFERMKGIVESHGGTVEKFIGDAVMAVFGIPQAHEDDALRACRAAVEMRGVLPDLGIRGRIGVNTGEVVTGTAERLATGDAVNVAARLEQAAEPGEVLIGEATRILVHDAAVIEPVEPLTLKGKAEPVSAYRLVAVLNAPERSHVLRFVGREPELARIVEAWDRAEAQASCELVTVVGDAGVGKSRLVAEALAAVEPRVVRGRCLPYGDGITYWPVVEVVKQLAELPSDRVAAAAIRSLLGESEVGSSGDEISWAFRKLLEEQAPLVVVFDDIQWGDETFLNLVESMALLSTGMPLLLLCMARPELVERRPGWPGMLRLEPLLPDQADELIGDGVSGELRRRIAHAAGGNPLFISEMVAMAAENADVEVPPTLRALLAARLDQLDEQERRVLERGSVEGEVFHRGSVQALAPEETEVTTRLAALVRHQLVRPDRGVLAGEDGFRFRHLLIRDAAYDALPKAVRADLHERFADWLEQHGSGLVERDEILGYHLEQAVRYRKELGMEDDSTHLLARRASDRLAHAGDAARSRDDLTAAVKLIGRALDLATSDERRLELELDLVEAEEWILGTAAASRRAAAVSERCRARGDKRGELLAELVRLRVEQHIDPEGTLDQLHARNQQALEFFERSNDEVGLLRAWESLGFEAFAACRFGDLLVSAQHRLELAARVGDERSLVSARRAVISCDFSGPTPVDKALARLDEYWQDAPPAVSDFSLQAALLAMQGHFDEARAIAAEADSRMAEISPLIVASLRALMSPFIEALAGDYEAAARLGRQGCLALEECGEKAWLSTAAPLLGQYLLAIDRDAEADEWADRGRQIGAAGDRLTQMLWRQVKAKVLARRGEHEEAERLAREARDWSEGTEMLSWTADVYADLAEVLALAGKHEDAGVALGQAGQLYERKGNVVMAERMRARQSETIGPA
jgi:class 3 adenylate cyclase